MRRSVVKTGVLFNLDSFGVIAEDPVQPFAHVPLSMLRNPVCIGRQSYAHEAQFLIDYVHNKRLRHPARHAFSDPLDATKVFDVRDVSAVQVSADIEGKRRYMETWSMLCESDFWTGGSPTRAPKKPMRIYVGSELEVVAMNMDDFWREYAHVKQMKNMFEPHSISDASREKHFDLPPKWTDEMTEYMSDHDFVHPIKCMLLIEENRSKVTFSDKLCNIFRFLPDDKQNFILHLSFLLKTPLKLIKRVDFDGCDKTDDAQTSKFYSSLRRFFNGFS
jgi:hypothetical protein